MDVLHAAYDRGDLFSSTFSFSPFYGVNPYPQWVLEHPRYRALWEKPGMKEVADAWREKGLVAGLPTVKAAVSKTGLHRLETQNPKNPNLSLIQAIAAITNVSPSWILFGEGSITKPDEFGQAIRGRVVDTIELLVGALDLTARQDSTMTNWLKSVRESKPSRTRKP